MRTRTFLGLILLVAALIVASTPALLNPTAGGVEKLAVEAGVLDDQAALEKARQKAAEERSVKNTGSTDDRLVLDGDEQLDPDADKDEAPASTLVLTGHQLQDDGDLRDMSSRDERESNDRGRLLAGAARAPLPGQLVSGNDPRRPSQYGAGTLLLDEFGCPEFGTWDPVAMWASPATKQQWLDRAAKADDPKLCRAYLERVVADAKADAAVGALPGDRRNVAASVRGDSERLLIQLHANGIYARIFDQWADVPELAQQARTDVSTGSASAAR